jgi:hypothetical protein
VINLLPLSARCPRQPQVQLALDDDGHLHLLAAVEGDLEATLARLTHAHHWVSEHRQLLALTSRDRAITEAPAVWHVFTADPKPALPLAVGGAFRLHLLKTVPGLAAPLHVRLV